VSAADDRSADPDARPSAAGFRVARLADLPTGSMDGDVEWRPVRHHLGIAAFGAGAWSGDAGVEVIERHDEHAGGADGHQELYFVASGRASFTVGGERVDAPTGTLVAVTDPALVRAAVAEEDGTTVLAIGAPEGRPYRVAPWESRRVG
jgi:hypothetical protein